MKKTLLHAASLAALAALASPATASDVQLYGVLDLGLSV